VILLLMGTLSARAQSVCNGPPYLGTSGPELCVALSETPGGATLYYRQSADVGDPPLSIVEASFGEYEVDLEVGYVFGPLGMEITIEGTVERALPGNKGIVVRAEGGWAPPLVAGSGDLLLEGFATGTSQIQQGGGAGFPVTPTFPEFDTGFSPFPVMIDVQLFGADTFDETLLDQPVQEGSVAIVSNTAFHLNDVGDVIDVPGGVVLGNPTVSGSGDNIDGLV